MNRSRSNAISNVPQSARRLQRVPVLTAIAAGLVLSTFTPTAMAATITVDASKRTAGNPHFWSHTVGTGTAKLALRGDWQTHYKIGNREAGFQRVRGHGLMDNIGMYKGAGSYDFAPLDTYLNAIAFAGMRPIMELDFFPSGMGTSRAPLSDYTNWKAYVTAVAKHCIEKFGADDVGKWYWEVWNEPDYDGFWSGTDMNKYYTLYDNTVDALTAVMPNILVGGPATTQSSPIKAFLQHCKSANKRVTFASSHNYPGGAASGTSASAATLVSDNDSRISGITGAGYTTADVKSFNTEWNSSYSGQGGGSGDAVTSMDNHWNVGFILKAAKLLSDKNSGDTPPLEVFSYWALTDVFDESSGTDGSYMIGKKFPFGQVFGMITVQGMRKAAFNAFKLLHYLGPDRLQSSGGTGNDGIDAMVTKSTAGDSIQILLYNYYAKLNTASGSGDSVTISVSNLPSTLAGKEVFVTTYVVDETHSNPYYVWKTTLSGTTSPSESDWQKMRHAQHLSVTTTKKTVDTTLSTTLSMLKQSGALVIISATRPLMGRNALVEIEAEDYDGQSGATMEDSGDSTTLGQSISIGSSGGNAYYENVDYTDSGVTGVQLRVKSAADTTVELHQDKADGTLLGKCSVTSTSNAWATQTCNLSQTPTGVSTLYLVFSGALHLSSIKFQGTGTGGTGGTVGGSGGAAGAGAGGSASGGAAGSGRGGAAGSGAGGAAGSGAGGAAGSGVGGSARGGAAGSVAAGGGAGGSGRGGAAGSGRGGAGNDIGSGGDGNTGAAGDQSGGSSGNDSGGSAGNGSSGSGGNSGSGSGGRGGATSTGGATPEPSDNGCSCHIGKAGGPFGALWIIGLAGMVLGLRRQRARRRR
jgi:xylan 1,4-beta-xylosidase